MVYRVSVYNIQSETHCGYRFFNSRSSAEQFITSCRREDREEISEIRYHHFVSRGEISYFDMEERFEYKLDGITVPKTKTDVVKMLNSIATHNDNG